MLKALSFYTARQVTARGNGQGSGRKYYPQVWRFLHQTALPRREPSITLRGKSRSYIQLTTHSHVKNGKHSLKPHRPEVSTEATANRGDSGEGYWLKAYAGTTKESLLRSLSRVCLRIAATALTSRSRHPSHLALRPPCSRDAPTASGRRRVAPNRTHRPSE